VAKRIEWADLPAALKDAISTRTGPITAARAVTAGQNSPLAAVIETRDGRVFAKGLPSGHRLVITQAREAAAAPLTRGISPELLWQFDEAGWNVLGFEHIPGRAAEYSPGSPDIDMVTGLMEALAAIEIPPGPGPWKPIETRLRTYVNDPADALAFAGHALTHTDWMPDNILISHGRAWLVDWAWATPGAGWTDPAFWLLRLIAHGHTIQQAEAHAARQPAYADADPAHLDAFARANVNMWNEIESQHPIPWAKTMARAARAWAQHRHTSPLSTRSVVTASPTGAQSSAPRQPSPRRATLPHVKGARPRPRPRQEAKSVAYQGWVTSAVTQPPAPIVGAGRNPSNARRFDGTRPAKTAPASPAARQPPPAAGPHGQDHQDQPAARGNPRSAPRSPRRKTGAAGTTHPPAGN
jgi:hypothetical protein